MPNSKDNYTREEVKKMLTEVLARHTFKKDSSGEFYVGLGDISLRKAQELLEADYYEIFNPR